MRRISTAVVLFAALAVLFAGSAQAAPATYADDAGDSFDGRASMDIVAVRYDVRRVVDAGPLSLVVEMELAEPPEGVLAYYIAGAQSEGCGTVWAVYSTGTTAKAPVFGSGPRGKFNVGCGSPAGLDGSTGTWLDAEFVIEGSTLRWSIALGALPRELRSGSTFRRLRAFARIAESATSIGYPADEASTDQTWSY